MLHMNRYIHLNRIEFVVTNACSGRCKHCSNAAQAKPAVGSVDAEAAARTVAQLAERFDIQSAMTFGGEPLLYADAVCKIHSAARRCGIPVRELITNGYFSKDEHKIDEVAQSLHASGVSDILVSVDVFHQEYIPLELVMQFAEALQRYGIPYLRVHPAWVADESAENPHNAETKRLLNLFAEKGIQSTNGNNIYPSGNALIHLAEYFAPPENIDLSTPCGSLPYTERLDDISCLGINPNGDVNLCSVTIGNIHETDILDIIDRYDPYANPAWRSLLDGGIPELLRYAETQGISIDTTDCRSTCGICRKIMSAIEGAHT